MAPMTASLRKPRATPPEKPPAASPATDGETQVTSIIRELAAVADYISHIKREIGALRANELCRDRLPMAHEELSCVLKATSSATHTIMAAAESILGSGEADFSRYRDQVETRMLEIFEACSFQDITGQRIAKVVEELGHLERRLGRFASAVNARDSNDAPDPEEALRQARREVLLLNGPASEGKGIAQDEIDKLFD